MNEKIKDFILVMVVGLTLVLPLLYFLPVIADPLIRDLTNQTEERYSKRMKDLAELRNKSLNDPAQDRLLYKNNDVPYHILSEFPRSGTYPTGRKKIILDDMNNLIEREEGRQTAARSSIKAISFFAAIQLFFFILAIVHEIFQGDVLKENATCKAINHFFSDRFDSFKYIITYVSSHSSTLIMTTGIAGTFYGLMQGLKSANAYTPLGFDIEMLFIALSISFISTLTGIFGGVLVRLIQQSLSGKATTMKDLIRAVEIFTSNHAAATSPYVPAEADTEDEKPNPKKSSHPGPSGTINTATVVHVQSSATQSSEMQAAKLERLELRLSRMEADQQKHWQEQTEKTSQISRSLDFIKKHLPKTKGKRR